jgi:hypothetical protein
MKTIEEVKAFYENAKVVECLSDGKHNPIDLDSISQPLSVHSYWVGNGIKNGITKIYNKDQGFAKIIEYKDEKLYTLKEECHKYIGAQTRHTTTTLEDWNLPLSMLDEVKEVDVKMEYQCTTPNLGHRIITYTIETKNVGLIGLEAHLEKATKEFFNR